MVPEKTVKDIALRQNFGELLAKKWLTAIIAMLLEMSGLNTGSVRAEDDSHRAPAYEQINGSYLADPYGATDAANAAAGKDFDQDLWETFNEKMFWFNRNVFDHFLLKPIASMGFRPAKSGSEKRQKRARQSFRRKALHEQPSAA